MPRRSVSCAIRKAHTGHSLVLVVRLSADLCEEAGFQAGSKVIVMEGFDADIGRLAIDAAPDDARDKGIRPLTLRRYSKGTTAAIECRLPSWAIRKITDTKPGSLTRVAMGHLIISVPEEWVSDASPGPNV